jgi:hypothetical protein
MRNEPLANAGITTYQTAQTKMEKRIVLDKLVEMSVKKREQNMCSQKKMNLILKDKRISKGSLKNQGT